MKVLIVEDDASSRDLLLGRLALQGHTAYFASSARAAVQLGRSIQPDVIFVDLNIDGEPLCGVELLCQFREEPATTRAVIYIHSVHNALAQDAVDAGLARGILPKPYTKAQLHTLLTEAPC